MDAHLLCISLKKFTVNLKTILLPLRDSLWGDGWCVAISAFIWSYSFFLKSSNVRCPVEFDTLYIYSLISTWQLSWIEEAPPTPVPPPTAKQKKFASPLCERTVQWTPSNWKRTALVRLRNVLDEFPHQSLPKPEIGGWAVEIWSICVMMIKFRPLINFFFNFMDVDHSWKTFENYGHANLMPRGMNSDKMEVWIADKHTSISQGSARSQKDLGSKQRAPLNAPCLNWSQRFH